MASTAHSSFPPEFLKLLKQCDEVPRPAAVDYSESRPHQWSKEDVESNLRSATLGASALPAVPLHVQAFSQALHSFHQERRVSAPTDPDTNTHPLPGQVTSDLLAWHCLNMPMGELYGSNARDHALFCLNQFIEERELNFAAEAGTDCTVEHSIEQSAITTAVSAALPSDGFTASSLADPSDQQFIGTVSDQMMIDSEPIVKHDDQRWPDGVDVWSNDSQALAPDWRQRICLPVFGGESASAQASSPSPRYDDYRLSRPSDKSGDAASIGTEPVTLPPPEAAAVPTEDDLEGREDMYLFGQSTAFACDDFQMVGIPYSLDCDENGSLDAVHCPLQDTPCRTLTGDSAIDLPYDGSTISPDVLALLKLVEMTSDASRSPSPSD